MEDATDLKMFIEFDKSKAKFFINYYLEEFRIELKIPLQNKDIDSNRIDCLNKIDFSDTVFLVSING